MNKMANKKISSLNYNKFFIFTTIFYLKNYNQVLQSQKYGNEW